MTSGKPLRDDVPVRDAATVILLRRIKGEPHLLFGQRGRDAVFMPSKFVFPGGRVDPVEDAPDFGLVDQIDPVCRRRLERDAPPGSAPPLLAAAIREVWEETGLRLSVPGQMTRAPGEWSRFSRGGHRPDAGGLNFVFRAITPPGPPRRFDARFFLVDAAAISGDPDDFSEASDELSHLRWVSMTEARTLDLPSVTRFALSEVGARVAEGRLAPEDGVPFYAGGVSRDVFSHLL